MSEIEIYTKKTCPYCIRAKSLLTEKGVSFKEIPIDDDADQRQVMIERSGRKTVPQIFINKKHIGGCDDLVALDEQGELDSLLK